MVLCPTSLLASRSLPRKRREPVVIDLPTEEDIPVAVNIAGSVQTGWSIGPPCGIAPRLLPRAGANILAGYLQFAPGQSACSRSKSPTIGTRLQIHMSASITRRAVQAGRNHSVPHPDGVLDHNGRPKLPDGAVLCSDKDFEHSEHSLQFQTAIGLH